MEANTNDESLISSTSEIGGNAPAERMDASSAEAEPSEPEPSGPAKFDDLSTISDNDSTVATIASTTNKDLAISGHILESHVENVSNASSSVEDIELKWDDDDSQELDSQTKQTDCVLKMLDKDLGEEVPNLNKPHENSTQDLTVKDVECNITDDKPNQTEADVANDSLEESQKIIDVIDNFTQDIEMDTCNIINERKNMLAKDLGEEASNLNKLDENCTKDLNVKDVDCNISDDKPNQTEADVANDSFEESQKIIAEIDNLTQDIEMDTSNIVNKENNTNDSLEENREIENVHLESATEKIDNFEDICKDNVTSDEKIDPIIPEESSKNISFSSTESLDVSKIADIKVTLDEPLGKNKCDLLNADINTIINKSDKTDIEMTVSDESENKYKEQLITEPDSQDTKNTIIELVDVYIDSPKEDTKSLETDEPSKPVTDSALDIVDSSSHVVNQDAEAKDKVDFETILPIIDNPSDKHDFSDKTDKQNKLALKIADTTSKMEDSVDNTTNMLVNESSVQLQDDSKSENKIFDLVSTKIDKQLSNVEAMDESVLDSALDATISPNIHHRIKKPNVMLDIPTQELSDIEAELSDSDVIEEIEKSKENSGNKDLDSSKKDVNLISPVSPSKSKEESAVDIPIESLDIQEVKKSSENMEAKASTSKAIDEMPSSSKDVLNQPTTAGINDVNAEKHTSDHTDGVQESDSMGLLAESSRVMDDRDDDDDDEADEPEQDDNDDDEDFDPYDESSSQMMEDTDDSNPALEKNKPPSPPAQADEGTLEVPLTSDVDDIECVENELPGLNVQDEATSDTPTEDKTKAQETENEAEEQKDKIERPDRIINILEKVLGNITDKTKETRGNILNFVEVEGSSDSDDVEEVSKPEEESKTKPEAEVGPTSGATSDVKGITVAKTQIKITSEPTNNAGTKTMESTKVKTETKVPTERPKEEVFNLDSDDDDDKKSGKKEKLEKEDVKSPPQKSAAVCVNPACESRGPLRRASRAALAYFTQARRAAAVCDRCEDLAAERSRGLVDGIKDLRPLLELQMDAPAHQLVEISDSDDDDDAADESDKIGEKGARFLEEHLADVFNETWVKYNMENRLKSTEDYILKELELIEAGTKELDRILDEVQNKTDDIRIDFYKDYEPRRKSLGGIIICDTPFSSYSHTEKDFEENVSDISSSRYPKRRSVSNLTDPPAKRQAVLDNQGQTDHSKLDEDKDLTVVQLSEETAPPSLPPHGEITRPPVQAGMVLFGMRHAFGTWTRAKVLDILPESTGPTVFTQCKVKFEQKVKNPCKVLAARSLAYTEPSPVRLTIGTRVIALFKDPQNTQRRDAFYAGVVAEMPSPVNNYRYLVFFDDGYAQYIQHADTRLVCESATHAWEEVHPFIREFIRAYLQAYPERPMVRLRKGETLNTEWNGKWWSSKVLQVDASIALIHFDVDGRTEWIYRGSTRLEPLYLELQAAAAPRGRARLQRSKQIRSTMPCVEYTRSEQANAKVVAEQKQNEELHRQRAVAKKFTTDRQTSVQTTGQAAPFDVVSRVVYYTPKNAVKPLKMVPHTCGLSCRRTDLINLRDLRTYNPLAKPLLSGWERQSARYKGHKEVMYRAPCGRRLRNMQELHKYLQLIDSELSVDLFDFTPGTHCLAEFVLNRCLVGKKDLSHGKENMPVPCVNYYDTSLPEFCSYNTERTPTAGVPLNLDPAFLCGCDCEDDCQDKSKCACWKMTLEGAKTIGLEGDNVGYVYRRLPEPLPSGIYECNSTCKCKKTCLNRVAQHHLQLKLQVFKTINRGWGIRALNDVPKGSFLCVYAGNLLTDATANLDGLNEGDEYLAELDYIEVVESMKEGYEDDVPEDKALDKKSSGTSSSSSSSEEEEPEQKEADRDFQPAYIPQPRGHVYFQKSLRRRDKKDKNTPKKEDCITISDDEEVREPSRFTADVTSRDGRHSGRMSVRELFGKDEACYIMDAKVQGNIGRYLNHSCHPNVFVQNVFVDTHDPRFPWVAFFALAHVRAGAELTWNYNYDVGSVPGKVLYCYCGAPNCRGRLL